MIDLVVTGSGVFQGADEKPDLALLERSLRRGLSDTTRLFMHAANLALKEAQAAPDAVHVVFASAFGEIATAEAMLAQAHDENDASPARFRNSVHNTAPGLFSISTKSTRPCTAISAGFDTVAMGLLEAELHLADGADKVLLVFAEEPVPKALSSEHHYGKLAAAFVLERFSRGRGFARVHNLRREARDTEDKSSVLDHPLGPALVLAGAIRTNRTCTVVVSEGAEPYWVDVSAAEVT